MTNLTDSLKEVRAQYVREEYAKNVHKLVRDHLEKLEPNIHIEPTHYFDHSAIPDFILSWGTSQKRNFFIRGGYASIVAGHDTEHLTENDPIFFALDANQEIEEHNFSLTRERVADQASSTTYSLLTDPLAFDEISGTSSKQNPLTTVISQNFLGGARGLIDEPVAEKLTRNDSTEGTTSALLREKFSEAAVLRMERTAQIVRMTLSTDREAEVTLDELSGKLSTSELRTLLPWVLKHGDAANTDFWGKLGRLFTFEQLEEVADEVDGLELTPLLRANKEIWTVRRAIVGSYVDADNDLLEPTARFSKGVLEIAMRDTAVRFSYDGRKLRGRPGSSSVAWDYLKPRLKGMKLQSVSLQGIDRSFQVGAVRSDDIMGDVDKMASSVEDTYFVNDLSVLIPGPEQSDAPRELEIVAADLGSGLLSADTPVAVGGLVDMAIGLLNAEVGSDLDEIRTHILGEERAVEMLEATTDDAPMRELESGADPADGLEESGTQ